MRWMAGGLVLTLAMFLNGCGSATSGDDSGSFDKAAVKVGVAYDIGGRGDQSFNDAAAKGLDEIEQKIPSAEVKELEATAGESDQAKEQRLRQLAQAGYNPVLAIGFAYSNALTNVAKEFPKTKFAIVDDAGAKGANVANLVFAEEQGSYLVGVAAGLLSKSGIMGFIGGADTPLITKFLAGYQAGVKSVKPGARVLVQYLSQAPDFSGFSAPDKAMIATDGMAESGADIIYGAAGGSGTGIFDAASQRGIKAIGVDSDQYNQPALAPVRDVILTSMVKRVDVAVFDFVTSVAEDQFSAGIHLYDLAANGVGYATSGGGLDSIKDRLDATRQKITSGVVEVPTVPADGE